MPPRPATALTVAADAAATRTADPVRVAADRFPTLSPSNSDRSWETCAGLMHPIASRGLCVCWCTASLPGIVTTVRAPIYGGVAFVCTGSAAIFRAGAAPPTDPPPSCNRGTSPPLLPATHPNTMTRRASMTKVLEPVYPTPGTVVVLQKSTVIAGVGVFFASTRTDAMWWWWRRCPPITILAFHVGGRVVPNAGNVKHWRQNIGGGLFFLRQKKKKTPRSLTRACHPSDIAGGIVGGAGGNHTYGRGTVWREWRVARPWRLQTTRRRHPPHAAAGWAAAPRGNSVAQRQHPRPPATASPPGPGCALGLAGQNPHDTDTSALPNPHPPQWPDDMVVASPPTAPEFAALGTSGRPLTQR